MSQPVTLPSVEVDLPNDAAASAWWEAVRWHLAGLAYLPVYALGIVAAFRAEAAALQASDLTWEVAGDRWRAATGGAARGIDALYQQARATVSALEGEIDQAEALGAESAALEEAAAQVRQQLDEGWPRIVTAVQRARASVIDRRDDDLILPGWHEQDSFSLVGD